MSTKGRVGGITEKKGRSPSLPLGQRRSSLTPSVLDRKKGSASIESKKVSISNSKKQTSDSIKPPRSLPPSKVTSARSKPNEKNVTKPPTKITGSTKPKDVVKSRPPLRPKNVLNVKENTSDSIKKQITKKGLENNLVVSEQNRIISESPPPSEMDHKIVTRENDNKTITVFDDILTSDCDKKLMEDVNDDILNNNVVEIETPPLHDPINLSGNQDIPKSEIRSRDNATIDGSVDIQEHTNDHDNEINVQEQVINETSETASDRLRILDPDPKVVDQENEGLEIERVAQDSFIGSKDVEQLQSNDQDHEETTQKEPENQKTDPEEPELEETDLKEPEPEETEPKEPQDLETQAPKEPEHQETQVPEELEHQETELPEEPENQETEVPEEPENKETEVPEEPENNETEVPEESEIKVPEEPENKETEVPEESEIEVPEEPKNKETEVPEESEIEVPEEPENKETEVPEEPEIQVPENIETEVPEETRVPEEPEHQETEPKEVETEEPEEPKHQETEEPEEPKHQETEEPKHQESEQKEAEKEPKEAEMKEGGAKEEGLGSKMVVIKKQEVVAYGKKELGKAYNDVIEETVSKLRRQRNNRVKALVGAFETVISLESNE